MIEWNSGRIIQAPNFNCDTSWNPEEKHQYNFQHGYQSLHQREQREQGGKDSVFIFSSLICEDVWGPKYIAILFSPRGSIRMRSPSYFVRISLRSLKIVGLFFVSCRKRALSAFMWCILANVQRRDRGNITSISNSKKGYLQFSQFCSLVSDSLHYTRLPHIVFTLVYENVHKGCLAPKEIWIFY